MPLMCEQANALVNALKRDVGYGKAMYLAFWWLNYLVLFGELWIDMALMFLSLGVKARVSSRPRVFTLAFLVMFYHQPFRFFFLKQIQAFLAFGVDSMVSSTTGSGGSFGKTFPSLAGPVKLGRGLFGI